MYVAHLGRPYHTVSQSANTFCKCTNYVTHELFLPFHCYLPTPVSKCVTLLSTLTYSVLKKDSIRKMTELCLLSWTNLNLIRDSTYTPSQRISYSVCSELTDLQGTLCRVDCRGPIYCIASIIML